MSYYVKNKRCVEGGNLPFTIKMRVLMYVIPATAIQNINLTNNSEEGCTNLKLCKICRSVFKQNFKNAGASVTDLTIIYHNNY